MTARHFNITFTAIGTEINGNLVRTGMSSFEEKKHAAEMLKAALGL